MAMAPRMFFIRMNRYTFSVPINPHGIRVPGAVKRRVREKVLDITATTPCLLVPVRLKLWKMHLRMILPTGWIATVLNL